MRRSARSSLVRLGKEDDARQALGRIREARSAFSPSWRRELRDEHALAVVLATALRGDSNAIDVGANVGAVLESIVRIAPAGRHIAYEPIPDLHEQLVSRFRRMQRSRRPTSTSHFWRASVRANGWRRSPASTA